MRRQKTNDGDYDYIDDSPSYDDFSVDLMRKSGTNRRNFTKSEDDLLTKLVNRHGENNWKDIAKEMPNRNTRQCKERWNSYLSPKINHGPWTEEEDRMLIQKHKELGPKWVELSKYFVGRSDNNVKNRWYTHLRKNVELMKDTKIHLKVPAAEEIPERTLNEMIPALCFAFPDELIQEDLFYTSFF